MSEDQKKTAAEWLMWTFRGAVALGAFFLMQTYYQVQETNELLNEHLREFSRVEQQVKTNERDIDKLWKQIGRSGGIQSVAR